MAPPYPPTDRGFIENENTYLELNYDEWTEHSAFMYKIPEKDDEGKEKRDAKGKIVYRDMTMIERADKDTRIEAAHSCEPGTQWMREENALKYMKPKLDGNGKAQRDFYKRIIWEDMTEEEKEELDLKSMEDDLKFTWDPDAAALDEDYRDKIPVFDGNGKPRRNADKSIVYREKTEEEMKEIEAQDAMDEDDAKKLRAEGAKNAEDAKGATRLPVELMDAWRDGMSLVSSVWWSGKSVPESKKKQTESKLKKMNQVIANNFANTQYNRPMPWEAWVQHIEHLTSGKPSKMDVLASVTDVFDADDSTKAKVEETLNLLQTWALAIEKDGIPFRAFLTENPPARDAIGRWSTHREIGPKFQKLWVILSSATPSQRVHLDGIMNALTSLFKPDDPEVTHSPEDAFKEIQSANGYIVESNKKWKLDPLDNVIPGFVKGYLALSDRDEWELGKLQELYKSRPGSDNLDKLKEQAQRCEQKAQIFWKRVMDRNLEVDRQAQHVGLSDQQFAEILLQQLVAEKDRNNFGKHFPKSATASGGGGTKQPPGGGVATKVQSKTSTTPQSPLLAPDGELPDFEEPKLQISTIRLDGSRLISDEGEILYAGKMGRDSHRIVLNTGTNKHHAIRALYGSYFGRGLGELYEEVATARTPLGGRKWHEVSKVRWIAEYETKADAKRGPVRYWGIEWKATPGKLSVITHSDIISMIGKGRANTSRNQYVNAQKKNAAILEIYKEKGKHPDTKQDLTAEDLDQMPWLANKLGNLSLDALDPSVLTPPSDDEF